MTNMTEMLGNALGEYHARSTEATRLSLDASKMEQGNSRGYRLQHYGVIADALIFLTNLLKPNQQAERNGNQPYALGTSVPTAESRVVVDRYMRKGSPLVRPCGPNKSHRVTGQIPARGTHAIHNSPSDGSLTFWIAQLTTVKQCTLRFHVGDSIQKLTGTRDFQDTINCVINGTADATAPVDSPDHNRSSCLRD